MPCVRDDGSLSPTAVRLMRAIPRPKTAEEVAVAAELPMYRVRSVTRELVAAGLAQEVDGRISLTPDGEDKLAAQT